MKIPMRKINKRRLLEYLIYCEIKEILYLFSFDTPDDEKRDLMDDLNEISEILKSLSYTYDVDSIREKFSNRYRGTYGKKLVIEDLVLEEDLSNKFNYQW